MTREEKMDTVNRIIAKNIRMQRLLKKLSQKQLAYKTGMDQSSVARIESCKRKVLADELTLFAEVLQINLDDLLKMSE